MARLRGGVITRLRAGKVTAAIRLRSDLVGKVFQETGHRHMRAYTRRLEDAAKREVPVDTGRLRESIHAQRVRTVGRFHLESRVTASAPYARFVHEGTRPHIIRARNAKALHFYWPKVGREVFFKSVSHPGTRANPFLRRAALMTRPPRRR